MMAAADLLIVPSLVFSGILMAPLSLSIMLGVAGASVLFALALDEMKVRVFAAIDMRQLGSLSAPPKQRRCA